MFKGSCVALVTPFKDGEVDYNTLKKLVNWHIESKTDCIVPCGCTGEAATLRHDEHKKVVETVIKEVGGRCPVMAGTGSNSTAETIELTAFAREAGADGALIITPYYNKPTQEGLYRHYRKVAESVDIPICLYNVPSRTGVNMLPETVGRLARIENITAVKEASGSVTQGAEVLRICGDDITLLSGDDPLTYALLAIGGKGVVSVLANVVPGVVHDICSLYFKGDFDKSLKLHYKWLPLMDALFIETNPGPVKEALGMMGRIEPELRLPLVNISEDSKPRLRKVLAGMSLVNT